ncbi:hypothetical protein [Hymenobacter sp. YC55]|uniref:hypothetical protein n=1 Tax=Hymenobacter sp. YC55 TaxID=3034019 RepID=UPI0023F87351|nr:hypothetical protein [Hymenobacter sp. YC55]MDF7810641.1 hypothetical protein [Hymenobacter sp. YC55]
MARSSLGLGRSLLCVLVFAAVGYLRPDHLLHHLDQPGLATKQPAAQQPEAVVQYHARLPRRRLHEWPLYLADTRAGSTATAPAAAPSKRLAFQRLRSQNRANRLKNKAGEKSSNTLVN